MPSVSQQLIGLASSMIASGRTRLVVTIAAISGLTAGIYFVRECSLVFGSCITVVAVVFIIAKTVQDIKSGAQPAAKKSNGPEGTDVT